MHIYLCMLFNSCFVAAIFLLLAIFVNAHNVYILVLCQFNFMDILNCHKVEVNLASLSFGDIARFRSVVYVLCVYCFL